MKVVVLDPTPQCPASRVAKQIVAQYDDVVAVRELADQCDVITYEFENVSADTLGAVADKTWVPQGTLALEICQDRVREKSFLAESQIPIAPYRCVGSARELREAAAEVGFPSVLKTTRGGYDGKGQVVLRGPEGADCAWEEALHLAEAVPCVLEAFVDFVCEISVVAIGNPQGTYSCFPPSENVHVNNILHQSIVPARINEDVAARARQLALRIAEQISLVGVMGVEMFVGRDGAVVVNELAPRPHNSGHYTIEACSLSQFDAHIRAVCGWPLPEPMLLSPAVMTNVLGQHLPGVLRAIDTYPTWSFHLYGKEVAAHNRKMGHITALTDDAGATLEEFERSKIWNQRSA